VVRLCFVALLLLSCVTFQAEAETGLHSDIDLQVRLAWSHASPGPIDGEMGKNTHIAVKAFQHMQGLDETGEVDEKTLAALQAKGDKPTVTEYEITKADVAGPFLDKIPENMIDMAKLDRLSYTSPLELLAEKFHMDSDLFRKMNEGKNFDTAGTTIRVANVADLKLETKVARIEIDKTAEIVLAYDDADQLVAAYPATIGSEDTPSPQGQHKVVAIAKNPTYTYDPKKLNFEGVQTKEKFTIPPGPNNPVGLVWIALDAPGYGIHGSPNPSKIRRQNSHGCVRLTNWDALQLADRVHKGVRVDFVAAQSKAAVQGTN
jgi:lipoprotein-anchoring transpeptidase ErfK/SrfK